MCTPLHAAVVHIEGTTGQHGAEKRWFNAVARQFVKNEPCPSCGAPMNDPQAAHVATNNLRKLLVHTCRSCNHWANDQDIPPFRIPHGRPFFDINKQNVFTQC